MLLGDAGYSCRQYFLTPFLHSQIPCEDRYNQVYIRTLNIEKCFCECRGMFRALCNDMQISLRTSKIVIIAMAVFFNI